MVIKSSGLNGASAAIFVGHCRLIGVSFVGDTATEPTLKLWDNATEGSGTEIAFLMVSDECHFANIMFPGNGVECDNGIYAQLSAAEGDYIVYYAL
ncbi:MAG: hypothetical protein H8D39_03095 [Candidatus Atribacteria bacterium]|nr:hypothetical protein [Candidatus Atribacteria bacterium]